MIAILAVAKGKKEMQVRKNGHEGKEYNLRKNDLYFLFKD